MYINMNMNMVMNMNMNMDIDMDTDMVIYKHGQNTIYVKSDSMLWTLVRVHMYTVLP
jgi:hypothetical protein